MTRVGSAWQRLRATMRSAGPLWTASLVLDRVVPAGVLGLWPEIRVPAETLARQSETLLRAWGMSPEHASITVAHMLYADLRGIDSHGCSMLHHYRRGLVEGWLTMTPHVEVVRESDTTALLDGGGGLGHVPADMAMKLALAKCKHVGLAAVAVRNSGHFGAAGAYASMAFSAGLIGIATTTTRMPSLVPTFGAQAMLGTNAIAFAAPAGDQAFTLDMATSAASLGAIMMAWRRGQSIPAGWAADADGGAVTQARSAAESRRLAPLGSRREMGSHKGYGLAVAVEILASVLSGSWRKTRQDEPKMVGHFFLALDPACFRDGGEFQTDLESLLDALRSSMPADPRQPVLVAGDPERAAYAERSQSGIPLSRSVVEDIRFVARESGVPFLLDTQA